MRERKNRGGHNNFRLCHSAISSQRTQYTLLLAFASARGGLFTGSETLVTRCLYNDNVWRYSASTLSYLWYRLTHPPCVDNSCLIDIGGYAPLPHTASLALQTWGIANVSSSLCPLMLNWIKTRPLSNVGGRKVNARGPRKNFAGHLHFCKAEGHTIENAKTRLATQLRRWARQAFDLDNWINVVRGRIPFPQGARTQCLVIRIGANDQASGLPSTFYSTAAVQELTRCGLDNLPSMQDICHVLGITSEASIGESQKAWLFACSSPRKTYSTRMNATDALTYLRP